MVSTETILLLAAPSVISARPVGVHVRSTSSANRGTPRAGALSVGGLVVRSKRSSWLGVNNVTRPVVPSGLTATSMARMPANTVERMAPVSSMT